MADFRLYVSDHLKRDFVEDLLERKREMAERGPLPRIATRWEHRVYEEYIFCPK